MVRKPAIQGQLLRAYESKASSLKLMLFHVPSKGQGSSPFSRGAFQTARGAVAEGPREVHLAPVAAFDCGRRTFQTSDVISEVSGSERASASRFNGTSSCLAEADRPCTTRGQLKMLAAASTAQLIPYSEVQGYV